MEKDGTDNEQETPVAPTWLHEEMIKDNGSELTLITNEKTLTASDLTVVEDLKTDFLTAHDKVLLKMKVPKSLSVFFPDPLAKKAEVELKKWVSGLALSTWFPVLKDYTKFKAGQTFSIWSYRLDTDLLCFSLVPNEEDAPNEKDVPKEEDPKGQEGPKDQEAVPMEEDGGFL